jgi:hypothetical protein
MALGDLVTADWQLEYAGKALGDGSPFLVAKIDGLLDLPAVTTADKGRLRRHGLIPGDDFTGGRSVVITFEVFGDTVAEFTDAVADLAALTTPGKDEQALVFKIPGVAGGGHRLIYCRPRKRSLPIGREYYYRLPLAQVEFVATDPRIYSLFEYNETTTLPSAGGGVTFPLTFPLTFGSVSTGGVIWPFNGGTFATPPKFTITGPVVNPKIMNVTLDKWIQCEISLAAGDTLTIDTEKRTIMLNGTASRYHTLTADSKWWELVPGSNEVHYSASTQTSSTLTVLWRAAWI